MDHKLTPELHRAQIRAYEIERPHYVAYADALREALERACSSAVPEAIVQARAKTLGSFAEKVVRKFPKYLDPVHQFTDLCGARVIVHTLEHVAAVCAFIERNFTVHERDDKSTALRVDQFGYRDTHFIVQLRPDRPLGLKPRILAKIGTRRAEIQIRTVVQHAWADILHDRIYKTPLRLSAEIKRTANLLAAVMEDGDRGFDRLAGEVDGMIVNYAANAQPKDVAAEIGVQELLWRNAGPAGRPRIALRFARLVGALGRWREVIEKLEPHAKLSGPLGIEIRSELGHALCRNHRARPHSIEYRRGQDLLRKAATEAATPNASTVGDPRQARCVQARALARFARSCEAIADRAAEARAAVVRAAELEPDNPYHFAEMLGWELNFATTTDLLAGFRGAIRRAIAATDEHAVAGTELPAACFTSGRLRLLLEEPLAALQAYARGLRYLLAHEGASQPDALDAEIAWLRRINPGRCPPPGQMAAIGLLELAGRMRDEAAAHARPTAAPVLMVAGGAAAHPSADLPVVQQLLAEGLHEFEGKVISGGTTAGVPGCVGAVAARLSRSGRRRFELWGYIPRLLPHDAQKDDRYDHIVVSGEAGFSADQVLAAWRDLIEAGGTPRSVLVLGFGGGPIAALEYRIALAFGATVAVVTGSGGAADALLQDPLWAGSPCLYPLPPDPKTIRALVAPVPPPPADNAQVLRMAQAFHERYRAESLHKIKPDSLKPWDALPETFRAANRHQAEYAMAILTAAGFTVKKAPRRPAVFPGFTPAEIELMAEMEHGRWNVERLRGGWRPGPRDDAARRHDCIVAWNQLSDGPEGVKRFDRDAVRTFPEILAKAGFEVIRTGKPVRRRQRTGSQPA